MLPDSFGTARLLLRPIAVEDAEAIFDTYAQDLSNLATLKLPFGRIAALSAASIG